jgi:SWI/SNF-related matrix-associated actin-dependent regulator of chromatin subfamily A-like protein 1
LDETGNPKSFYECKIGSDRIKTEMSKLRRYQKIGVRKICQFDGRAILADEMRLGKTIQALWYLKINKDIRPALVVCPASVKYVWEEQAKEHIGMDSIILEGKTRLKPKRYPPPNWPALTIINYDILDAWKDFLTKMNYKILIIDEPHFIKNYKAKRTRACRMLGKKIDKILALGGTILVNRPIEMYNTLNLVRPDIWNHREDFKWRYCDPKWTPWGWNFSGACNLDKLHKELKRTCMIRRRRSDVLEDLPEKERSVVSFRLVSEAYNHAEENFIKEWLAEMDREAAEKAKSAGKVVKHGHLKRLAAELKLPFVNEWIDSFLEETEEKLVVFAIHKKIIGALKEKYKKQCVVVDGSVTGAKRKEAINRFRNNKTTRLFIGNIIAAGAGISLKPVNTVVFAELDFVPGNHLQAEDRIIDAMDSQAAEIYYLIAKNTIEEDLCKIIQKKAKVISSVLDGGVRPDEDLNIHDLLENMILERIRK